MREVIKKHIGMIQKGEVPEGYKKTKVGIIPIDWNIKNFGSLCSSKSGKYNANFDKKFVKCIELENIVPNQGMINGYFNGAELESTKNVFEKNNVLYGKLRPYLRKYYHTQCNGVCSSEIWVLKPKKTISSYYLYLLVQSDKFNQFTNLSCCGSKMPRADWEYVEQTLYPIPLPEEQEKIVDIMNVIDKKISKIQALIVEKEKQKKWFMQNLLTAQKRVRGYKCDWKKIKIKKFIKELNEKTTENNQYEILSVTKDGIFKQSEHFNKQIASEDNCGYKVVRRNNLVFSTMNLWMGSLDVLKKYDFGIVSPAYKIFAFDKQYMIPEFGEYFMKSNYMIWIYGMNSEQGASIVRRNLDMDGLLNTFVNIPEIEEQKAIAKILSQADKEIELLQQRLEQTKLEKKAMMQLLLTGIVRVNKKGGE